MQGHMNFKWLVWAIALIAFLAVGNFGFLHAIVPSEHDHCPLMPAEMSVCDMDVFGHLDSWRTMFVSIFIFGFFYVTNALRIFCRFLFPVYLFSRSIFRLTLFGPPRPVSEYQILFSKGILNSKAY